VLVVGLLGTAWALGAGAAPLPPAPPVDRLMVEVRTAPPDDRPAFHRGADRSYTVSTGGGVDRDDMPAPPSGHHAMVLRAGDAQRVLHVRAGEALRVDLPARQSLQFHVAPPPAGGGRAGGARAGASGAVVGASGAPVGATGRAAATGVVYFDAVAAFRARFHLAGELVRIDLVPLQTGDVAAPWIDVGPERALHDAGQPLSLHGRAGSWIALGDADIELPARSLSPTAEPPSPAGLWVRVTPDVEAPQAGNGAEVATRP